MAFDYKFNPNEVFGGKVKAVKMVSDALATKGAPDLDPASIAQAAKSETNFKTSMSNQPDFAEAEGIKLAVNELRSLFPSFDEHWAQREALLKQMATPVSPYDVTPEATDMMFAVGANAIDGVSPSHYYKNALRPYDLEFQEAKDQKAMLDLINANRIQALDEQFKIETDAMRSLLGPVATSLAKRFAPQKPTVAPPALTQAMTAINSPNVPDDLVQSSIELIMTYVYGPEDSYGTRRGGAYEVALANQDYEYANVLAGYGASAKKAMTIRDGKSSASRKFESGIDLIISNIQKNGFEIQKGMAEISLKEKQLNNQLTIARERNEVLKRQQDKTYAGMQLSAETQRWVSTNTREGRMDVAKMQVETLSEWKKAYQIGETILKSLQSQKDSLKDQLGQLMDADGVVAGRNRKRYQELLGAIRDIDQAISQQQKKLNEIQYEMDDVRAIEDEDPGNSTSEAGSLP